MHRMGLVFSPWGRLKPVPFVCGIVAVYAAGAVSHLLTTQGVVARAGPWPFLAIQVMLVWIWFALHARRLRDAGRRSGVAVGAAIIYALSIALLAIVMLGFFENSNGPLANPAAGAALNLILVLRIVGSLLGPMQFDLAWALVAILIFFAFVPIVVAVAVTAWAATRPSLADDL